MSEGALSRRDAPASTDGIAGPLAAGSRHYQPAAAPWQATTYPGFWIKPLYSNPATGERTMLMKVDAGAFAATHAHPDEFEQVYVLDGTFYDQDGVLEAGSYCCRAPGAPHSGGSHAGATLLVLYARAAPPAPAA